jgi:hypothetical protein
MQRRRWTPYAEALRWLGMHALHYRTGKVYAGLTPHRLSLQGTHGNLRDPNAELRLAENGA